MCAFDYPNRGDGRWLFNEAAPNVAQAVVPLMVV